MLGMIVAAGLVQEQGLPFCAGYAVSAPAIRRALGFDTWLGTATASGLKGHQDYCQDHGPCGAGEGNCDTDSECRNGLTCVNDVGATYGLAADVNVCQAATSMPSGTTTSTQSLYQRAATTPTAPSGGTSREDHSPSEWSTSRLTPTLTEGV